MATIGGVVALFALITGSGVVGRDVVVQCVGSGVTVVALAVLARMCRMTAPLAAPLLVALAAAVLAAVVPQTPDHARVGAAWLGGALVVSVAGTVVARRRAHLVVPVCMFVACLLAAAMIHDGLVMHAALQSRLLADLAAVGLLVAMVGPCWRSAPMLLEIQNERDLHASIMRTSVAAITVLDRTGRILFANSSAERVLGLRPSEIESRKYDSPQWQHTDVDGGPWPDERQPFRVVMRTRQPVSDIRHAITLPDGSRQYLSINGEPLFDETGEIYRVVFTVSDITASVLSEKAHATTEARLASIIGSAMDSIVTIDDDQRIILFNRAAERTFGYSADEVLGEPLAMLIPEEYRAVHAQHIRDFARTGVATRSAMSRPLYGLRRNGEVFPMEASISQTSAGGRKFFTAILRDVAEARRAAREHKLLEEQLWHSQKMEALGQLAGGVAHDFNNLLTVIINSLYILRARLGWTAADLPPGSPALKGLTDSGVFDPLSEIEAAATRAGTLTRQLLTFSRRDPPPRGVFDLAETVRHLGALLRRLIDESTVLDIETPEEPLTVNGDRMHVEQMLMNLVVNAKDAVEGIGGRIRVRVMRDGAQACVSVSDDGVGMTERQQQRIFEPFFTTKPTGKGTGLGLSTVFGIVEQMGGYIQVTSEPGKGSTFNVWLPMADQPVASSAPAAVRDSGLPPNSVILLCEDDQSVRTGIMWILANAGYQVLPAATGEDALRLARESGAMVDLVMTDIVMPEVNGPELIRRMRLLLPGVPAIMLTGYPAEHIQGDATISDVQTLAKPVDPDELLRIVEAALRSGRAE
ncbi:MAG: PAS domain S-box protein [Planctomycetota bacterium]